MPNQCLHIFHYTLPASCPKVFDISLNKKHLLPLCGATSRQHIVSPFKVRDAHHCVGFVVTEALLRDAILWLKYVPIETFYLIEFGNFAIENVAAG